MRLPVTTAAYAAFFGLLFSILSAIVIAGRFQTGVLHGAGDNPDMLRRMRMHGNFAEYVPLILLLCALVEGAGAPAFVIHVLLAPLFVARLTHPFGMWAPPHSTRQYLLRGLPVVVTLLVLAAGSALLLMRIL